MPTDTDSMPLDGAPDLSEAERLALRRLLRDDERAAWARRKLKVIVPVLVSIVVGMWQLFETIKAHVTFK
jgi:hypothetical protein